LKFGEMLDLKALKVCRFKTENVYLIFRLIMRDRIFLSTNVIKMYFGWFWWKVVRGEGGWHWTF